MSIQQLNDVYLKAGLKDKDGDLGTSGFLLSSTGTQTDWLDPNEVSVGSSENVEILVKNISSGDGGVSLSKGDPIYIYGSVGASARLYVDLADADSTATNNNGDGKMPCAGLLAQDLAPNGEGVAIVVGKLRNLITSPIDGATPTENDTLYVKSGGGLTLTKPTGATNLIQNVGQVGRVDTASDGNIVVSAILRSNDVPNLPTGRIWVGDSNTTTSGVVYLDETNNRLGLNTITPGYLLDVQQSGTQGYIRAWDGGNEFFKLQSDGEFKIGDIDFSNNGSYLELSNGDQFKFFTGGTEQFLLETGGAELEGRLLVADQGTTTVQINSAGNSYLNGGDVGIATTSPEAILHINGTNDTTYWGPLIKSTSANPARLTFTNTEGSGFIDQNDNALRFYHNSAYRMYINSSGKVGIGTTSPSYKLDIAGDLRVDNGNIGSTSGDELTHARIQGARHFIDLKEVRTANDTNWRNTTFKIQTGVDSTNHQSIDFVTDGSYREHIDIKTGNQVFNTRFTYDGKVGIGTTSPDSKLQISGSGTQRLRVTSTDGANADLSCDGISSMTLGSPNGIPIRFVTSNQERARVTSTGNVGIKNTNPGSALHVGSSAANADIKIEGVSTANLYLTYPSGSTGATKSSHIGFSDTQYVSENTRGRILYTSSVTDSLNKFQFRVNFTDIMTMMSDKVGIGTTSPSARLDVYAAAKACRIRSTQNIGLEVQGGGNSTDIVIFKNTNGTEKFSINTHGQMFNLGMGSSSSASSSLMYNSSTGLIYRYTSSIRYKEDVTDLENAVDKIKELRPVSFKSKDTGEYNTGMIAEEVFEVMPEITFEAKIEGFDEPQVDGICYEPLHAYYIKAIQELSSKIEQLETRIQTLENN